MFVPDKHFQASLMSVSEAWAYLSGEQFNTKLYVWATFPANNKLDSDDLKWINTLAYLSEVTEHREKAL
jgi:hypothetical protein